MPATTLEKLQLQRRDGHHNYGLTLHEEDKKRKIEITVTGKPISTYTVLWTAKINGKIIVSDVPRKKEAMAALTAELQKRGEMIVPDDLDEEVTEGNGAAPNIPQAQAEAIAVKAAKRAAAQTHPIFRVAESRGPAQIPAQGGSDPLLDAMIRIKGTTLVGTVKAISTGKQERLRVQFPEGHFAWIERSVAEDVLL